MPRVIVVALTTLFAFALAGIGSAHAQIKDPAVHGLKRLEPLQFGVDGDSSKMAPTEYKLKVGQGYRWKIKASDLTEYAFVAPAFARNIWIRKIEVGDPIVLELDGAEVIAEAIERPSDPQLDADVFVGRGHGPRQGDFDPADRFTGDMARFRLVLGGER